MDNTARILKVNSAFNPFENQSDLRSLTCGLIADKQVNVDDSKQIGNMIPSSMVKADILEYKVLLHNY